MKFIEAVLINKYHEVLKSMGATEQFDVPMLFIQDEENGKPVFSPINKWALDHEGEYMPAIMNGDRIQIYWTEDEC